MTEAWIQMPIMAQEMMQVIYEEINNLRLLYSTRTIAKHSANQQYGSCCGGLYAISQSEQKHFLREGDLSISNF
jgi:hypothetical protein